MHEALFRFPARRLRDAVTHRHEQQRGQSADSEHDAPSIVSEAAANRVVGNSREKDSDVITGMHVARAGSPSTFWPLFGDERAAHGPLAADADPGEQAKEGQLPQVVDECA